MNPMSANIAFALSVMSAAGDDARVAEFQNAVTNRGNGGNGAEALAIPIQFAITNVVGGKLDAIVAQVPELAAVSAKLNGAKWYAALGSLAIFQITGAPDDIDVGYITGSGSVLKTFSVPASNSPNDPLAADVFWSVLNKPDGAPIRFSGIILIYKANP